MGSSGKSRILTSNKLLTDKDDDLFNWIKNKKN
jgi:succinate dehydrogenase flavin-adding protein (antitoxin of CptAB toxin-antitoxin module)